MTGQRRHPCLVTAERLGDHYERYFTLLSGSDLRELSRVKFVLERIAGEHDKELQ